MDWVRTVAQMGERKREISANNQLAGGCTDIDDEGFQIVLGEPMAAAVDEARDRTRSRLTNLVKDLFAQTDELDEWLSFDIGNFMVGYDEQCDYESFIMQQEDANNVRDRHSHVVEETADITDAEIERMLKAVCE